MPDLKLQEKEVAEMAGLDTLEVDGTLDVATIPMLEEALEGLRQRQRTKIIVDLAKMEYISSSGLGAFLGMVDGFRDRGGDLVFVNLTARVKKIFTVVGFNRILTIFDDMKGALSHFSSQEAAGTVNGFALTLSEAAPHSGEAFELEIKAVDDQGRQVDGFDQMVDLRPSTGIVSPAHAGPLQGGVWKGKVILTGPGTVTLTVEHGNVEGTKEVPLREDKPPAKLPLEIRCPRCGVSTQIAQFNVYRCKQCDEVYFVDQWAHAISLRSPDSKKETTVRVLNIRVPADVNLLGPLRVFLATSLKESGFDEDYVNDMELCVDEAVTNVVEHAYEYDISGSVQVTLTMDKDRASLEIKDQGKPFDPNSLPKVDLDKHIKERKTGGLGYYLMNTFMDRVHYEHDGTSNILTLEKNKVSKKKGEAA